MLISAAFIIIWFAAGIHALWAESQGGIDLRNDILNRWGCRTVEGWAGDGLLRPSDFFAHLFLGPLPHLIYLIFYKPQNRKTLDDYVRHRLFTGKQLLSSNPRS